MMHLGQQSFNSLSFSQIAVSTRLSRSCDTPFRCDSSLSPDTGSHWPAAGWFLDYHDFLDSRQSASWGHVRWYRKESWWKLHSSHLEVSSWFPSSFSSLAWTNFSATEPDFLSSCTRLSWAQHCLAQGRTSRPPACSPWKMVFWKSGGKLFHSCILYWSCAVRIPTAWRKGSSMLPDPNCFLGDAEGELHRLHSIRRDLRKVQIASRL